MTDFFIFLASVLSDCCTWLFSASLVPGVSLGAFLLCIYVIYLLIDYVLLKAN